ncbi:hypothetical protein PF001_g31689 [Phytophthora fragariae]|uniref:Uncharacterized protein n=1 Tax=Phytophthora fragariae TaxID=53985 RepID=A0A6A4AT01_9STRA|nr:hypothetical protein PF003_g32590 [Phytophthora fragariae]KAE8893757.1 hypothetical protein PF003_g22217 [Phytophthora fragariae]KAE8961413.1 hypothetical protein PF011_g29761 [Phytophthora fragariae]KAE9166652.1 hypothetical protein PF004_g29090 [Phytophthora fragariae]KAE9263409.1 hypothetical protein PF001_g31689 [Phytophthora fragariae]
MQAHSSSRQSEASVNDVGAAKHGYPEIRLVGKGVTPAHGATTNTFSLPRCLVFFFILSISNHNLILTTGCLFFFNLVLRLINSPVFVANPLALSPRFPFLWGLLFATSFVVETIALLLGLALQGAHIRTVFFVANAITFQHLLLFHLGPVCEAISFINAAAFAFGFRK